MNNPDELTQSELFESEERYRCLMEAADDRIALYDEGHELVTANPAFYSSLGYSRAEYHNLSLESIVHSGDLPVYHSQWEQAAGKRVFTFQVRLRHGRGHWLHFSAKTALVERNNRNNWYYCIMRDITDTIRIQEEMCKAKETAEIGEKLKSAFLANMSHEIRTPLNGIIGFSRLLIDESINTETKMEYYGYIRERSNALLSIIDNLVEISQLDTGRVEIHQRDISLNKIFSKLLADVKEQYGERKAIEWAMKTGLPDDHDRVIGDEGRIIQIMKNLLDNACKFTTTGSITFTYEIRRPEIVFSVVDTGVGIPAGMQKVVFDRFRQVDDSYTRKYGGNGLGLAISKSLISLMQGRIWIESEENSGTAVFFTIPYQPVLPRGSRETVANKVDLDNRLVLVVEDDFSSAEFFKILLRKAGMQVLHVDNGRDVMPAVRENHGIELVLMDIQLPGIDGLSLTRLIKKDFPGLPVIAQTAHASLSDQENFTGAGCSAYVSKPVDPEELLKTMRGVLKGR